MTDHSIFRSLSAYWEDQFFKDMHRLRVRDPDTLTRVTEYVPEIVDFVETAKGEADGEEVLARLTAREGGVELAVLTRSGQELDRRVFDLGDSGLTVADVSRFLEGSVAVVDGTG